MLPCQQPMMLDKALAFEKLALPTVPTKNLISSKSTDHSLINVTWDNPEQLKIYIDKLKEAANKLTDHNRYYK